MNIIIKKIMSFDPKSSLLISVSALLAGIIIMSDWKNQNWFESILLLLLIAIFLFYKKQSSSHEAHLHALLDNISDAIITIDSKGSILSLNNAVEHMFGYQPSELLGENIKVLMPAPYSELHDNYLSNYIKTGQAHVVGTTREVKALRRNGYLEKLSNLSGDAYDKMMTIKQQ